MAKAAATKATKATKAAKASKVAFAAPDTTAQFRTTALANDDVLVEGTDFRGNTGSQIVCGKQWAGLKQHDLDHEALEAYDKAVEEFWAPLTEAAAKAEQSSAIKVDTNAVFVLHEGVDHVEGQPAQVVELTVGSQILRLLETGKTERLLWVGDDLVITAAV